MSTNRPTTESEDLDQDPFELLASEFAERYRKGERPSIEEYAAAHPELAEEIRDLFPTIAAMEKSKAKSAPPVKLMGPTPGEDLPLQQLGDYRLLGEIGRGGMGIVYEAEQISLRRHVAVKVLPKQALLDERHLRRFEREAQTAAKLHHTNIVPVFGVGQQDGYHYIVMQFIPGVGLDEILLALRRILFDSSEALDLNSSGSHRMSHANHNAQALLNGGFGDTAHGKLTSPFLRKELASGSATAVAPASSTGFATKTVEFSTDSLDAAETQPPEQFETETENLAGLGSEFYMSVAKIGEQVADALAYAHEQGTLHRDIKPGNLLLDATGTVWVADFGLAKLDDQDNVSRTGDIVGTLSYIPPESFSGPTDARGDIYSLGLSLFELLALRPAFFGRDRNQLVKEITEGKLPKLSKLNPNVPRDLETIVLKAVAHRPEDRYATAADLASDLSCFLNDQPITARRMSIPEQFTRWYRKNKLVAALSTAVASLLVALTVLFGVIGYQARKSAEQLGREIEQKDIAKQLAEVAADDAEQQRQQAETERQKARDLASEAIQAIKNLFAGLAPHMLPVSAGPTLSESDPLNASYASADNVAETESPEGNQDEEDGGGLVAPPPISQETTARLEILLSSLEMLAEKAENYADFAATFADLTLRVGMLHKALGNNERALDSIDRAIYRFESLVSDSNTIPRVIGLAVCFNEKAELLGSMNEGRESASYFRRAQQLLEEQRDQVRLDSSPRAQYELARTMYLMSIQWQERPGSMRRGPRPPGRIGFYAEGNLRRAIDLLKPLVASESNSEYRYLLARCYSALGSIARPEDRKQHIEEANSVLEDLVRSVPGVDNYKYEFAIVKLRRAASISNIDNRLQVMEDAVDLLDQICGRNPDIFNYQLARARALDRYVVTLDRAATQLATSSGADNRLLAQILRNDATDEAMRAAELFVTLRARFADAFVDRLPDTYEVTLAEIISQSDPDTAVPYFRDAANTSQEIPKSRAEIGLARSLIYTDFSEAYEVLVEASSRLQDRCTRELGRFFPDNERFLEPFTLWAEATMILQGNNFDSAEPMIDAMVKQRLDSIGERIGTYALPSHRAEIQLRLANVYTKVTELEKARQLRDEAIPKLEAILERNEGRGWEVMTEKLRAIRLLRDHYFNEGLDEKLESLEAKMSELRNQMPRGRRGRRSRRPVSPPPDGPEPN